VRWSESDGDLRFMLRWRERVTRASDPFLGRLSSQVQRLLDAVETSTHTGLRDRALLGVLARFTAGASIYKSTMPLDLLYRALATGASAPRHKTVSLAADSCQCTSPHCTWSCPTSDPCLQLCGKLVNVCERKRCVCTCNGGIPVPAPGIPCGFVCT
jgi:hypothetical protein